MPIAPGSDDVHDRDAEGQRGGMRHHRLDHPAKLVAGLTLGPERDEDACHHGRRNLAIEDEVHQRCRLGTAEVNPIDQRIEHACSACEAGLEPAWRQSHHRSWLSRPRAMRPSWTWLVPSTIVSCLASRYHSSVG